MQSIADLIQIYLFFIKIRILSLKEYRMDFFFGTFSIIFMQFVNVIFLSLVFQCIPSLNGWILNEIMFIYGFSILSMGISTTFFGNIGNIPDTYIVIGKLDRLLLRPIPILLHIVADNIYLNNVANITLGVGILIFSALQLHLVFSPLLFLLFLILLMCSTLIYSGIQLICVCTCFWFVDRWAGVLQLVMKLHDFSRYPVNIFGDTIQFFITWIIPFAFTGFFPTLVFLRRSESYVSYLTILMAVIICSAAYILWRNGLKHYESSGT